MDEQYHDEGEKQLASESEISPACSILAGSAMIATSAIMTAVQMGAPAGEHAIGEFPIVFMGITGAICLIAGIVRAACSRRDEREAETAPSEDLGKGE